MFKITVWFAKDSDARYAIFAGVPCDDATEAKLWGNRAATQLGLRADLVEVERTSA